MLSFAAIRQTVDRHWSDAMTELPTRRPDERMAAERHPAWAELWVQPGEADPRRAASPDRLAVEVIVHLFVQPRASTTSVEAWADRIRSVLKHQTLAGDGCVVRLREVTAADLSRDDDADGLAARHWVLLAPGTAEAVPVAAVSSEDEMPSTDS